MSDEPNFDERLKIVQIVVAKLFNDEIANIVFSILEDGFEENDEIIQDISDYDDCSIISEVSKEISTNDNDDKSKWNQDKDQQTIHTLLTKIFQENIVDTSELINLFTSNDKTQSQQISIPKTLIECKNTDILYIACTIAEKINEESKKKVNLDDVKQCFNDEPRLNGEFLSNMNGKSKEFVAIVKKYNIGMGKARKIFDGIINYFDTDTDTNAVKLKCPHQYMGPYLFTIYHAFIHRQSL